MVRTHIATLTTVLLMVSVLSGCRTTELQSVSFDPDKTPVSTSIIGKEDVVTYEEISAAVQKLKNNATAQEIANTLTTISAVRVREVDKDKVTQLEIQLLSRLRFKVKSEVQDLHQTALTSSSYSEGYTKAREAAAIVALYPLSDDSTTLKEADDLSMRQNQVLHRLELIRRQRYNYWSAGQADEALKQLRENGKKGTEKAIEYLSQIEPSLLESSVASIYSYVVNELMDKCKKDEMAEVAKKLTDPSVNRRDLEGF